MELLWFIPAYGDGRYLGTTKRGRAAEYGYYKQVAAAADYLGYWGVLLPTGQGCEGLNGYQHRHLQLRQRN